MNINEYIHNEQSISINKVPKSDFVIMQKRDRQKYYLDINNIISDIEEALEENIG